ncbi:MAG: outer membrane protein assembly factor BamC [Methylohalobius sp.]|nr:outer membrane protein assembly factor BamC [Methylohalobius sp.]
MRKSPGWLLVLGLASCTYLVPDREQEYAQVRPLPPLKWPDTLEASPQLINPPPVVPNPPPPSLAPTSAGTVPFIELDQPFQTAWVTTLKALNLLRLELSGRDAERGILYLIYTPPAAETELAVDRNTWEDLAYFVTGNKTAGEQKYQLLLQPNDNTTRLYLLDLEGKPRTDRITLELLERLKQTLSGLTQ